MGLGGWEVWAGCATCERRRCNLAGIAVWAEKHSMLGRDTLWPQGAPPSRRQGSKSNVVRCAALTCVSWIEVFNAGAAAAHCPHLHIRASGSARQAKCMSRLGEQSLSRPAPCKLPGPATGSPNQSLAGKHHTAGHTRVSSGKACCAAPANTRLRHDHGRHGLRLLSQGIEESAADRGAVLQQKVSQQHAWRAAGGVGPRLQFTGRHC